MLFSFSFLELFDPLLEYGVYTQVALGVLVILLTYLFFSHSGQTSTLSRSKMGNDVIFVGACGSGKTCLVQSLVNGKFPRTVTSMEQSSFGIPKSIAGLSNGKLIDLPGHPRLRGALGSCLPSAFAIVFVVDSRDVSSENFQNSTELLAHILTQPVFVANKIPVLIACNKSDMHGVKSPELIYKKLETGLDKIKETRSALMQTSMDQTGENEILLGSEERFEFDIDVDANVTFCSCSAKEHDVKGILSFIEEAARTE
jgi:signal recognition particle receptor subunit beta